MNIISLLNNAKLKLEAKGIDTPKLDAEVLLAHVLGIERVELYTKKDLALSQELLNRFKNHMERRAAGCPVAYITGVKEFWSIPIKVTPDVLIPRPETELVVERALEIMNLNASRFTLHAPRILDLCTGSGCIAAALAKELPEAKFTVTDISPKAIEVARSNLEFAVNRTTFCCGDLFDAISLSHYLTISRKFDLITCNPPYVPTGHRAMFGREITEYEPEIALYGGKSGLDFMIKIIEHAAKFLKNGGWLVMEMGLGQAEKLVIAANEFGGYGDIVISKDLAEIERVISLKVTSALTI